VFIKIESEIDAIFNLEVKLSIWQKQIEGLRRYCKRSKIINSNIIVDKRFEEKKFMVAYYNDKQFIELSKLKIDERKEL
jgi:hypothetical protein